MFRLIFIRQFFTFSKLTDNQDIMKLRAIVPKFNRKPGLHILLSISLLLVACHKEQLLVRKIEGTYTIGRILYSTSRGDSLVHAPGSTMYFDDCVLKSPKQAQQCAGYIDLNGTERIIFNYRPEKDGNKISMFLNIGEAEHLNRFGGRYLAEERTDDATTLVRYSFNEYREKKIDLKIFLTR